MLRKKQDKHPLEKVCIQRNINFLHRPMWLPIKNRFPEDCYSYYNSEGEFVIEYKENNKYILRGGSWGLPNYDDMKWLLLLLQQANLCKNFKKDFTVRFHSFYEFYTKVGIPKTDSRYWLRFIEAVHRWKQVNLIFYQDSFYDNNNISYKYNRYMLFDIITTIILDFDCSGVNDCSLEEIFNGASLEAFRTLLKKHYLGGGIKNKKVKNCEITFNPTFIKANQESYSRTDPLLPLFYMSPLACRLYEILSVLSYRKLNSIIKFHHQTLEKKLGRSFPDSYQRAREIKKAVSCINEISNLQFYLNIIKNKNKDSTYEFIRIA